jgi:hypothetical protein
MRVSGPTCGTPSGGPGRSTPPPDWRSHRLRPAMPHSRPNSSRARFRARLFRDRRSLSVTGLCLAGLSDDEAELRDDFGDGGFGGLKGNNLARTRSRNKQFGVAYPVEQLPKLSQCFSLGADRDSVLRQEGRADDDRSGAVTFTHTCARQPDTRAIGGLWTDLVTVAIFERGGHPRPSVVRLVTPERQWALYLSATRHPRADPPRVPPFGFPSKLVEGESSACRSSTPARKRVASRACSELSWKHGNHQKRHQRHQA